LLRVRDKIWLWSGCGGGVKVVVVRVNCRQGQDLLRVMVNCGQAVVVVRVWSWSGSGGSVMVRIVVYLWSGAKFSCQNDM